MTLATIYLVALALRLIPLILFPSINYLDEIYQTVEQAHRLVFGYGALPWEFEFGARSWLLPGFLAGLMKVGSWFGSDPTYYLNFIHLTLAAIAASVCICSYLWGQRFFGSWGGVVAAALPALWPDAVYFAGRTLNECVAAPLLVIAAYLIEPGYRIDSRRRLMVAGALLGLAIALRLQLAPAAAVIMLWTALDARRQRLLAIAVGLGVTLAFAGGLDAVTWSYPFESVWRNIVYNTNYGVSAYFGTEPWYFYGELLLQYWRPFVVIIPLLAVIGASRVPTLVFSAVTLLVAHSVIAHKEPRFIYPAILLLIVAAGLGMAWLVTRIAQTRHSSLRRCIVIFVSFTVLSSGALAVSAPYRELWQRGHDMVEAALYVSRLDSVCGIGVWRSLAAYTYFHRPVPYYWTDNPMKFESYLPGFNTMIAEGPAPTAVGYTVSRCFGKICVAQRTGPCEATPMPKTQIPAPLAGASPG